MRKRAGEGLRWGCFGFWRTFDGFFFGFVVFIFLFDALPESGDKV